MDSIDFVVCDVSTARLPILHASPGFLKLYGCDENCNFLDLISQPQLQELEGLDAKELQDGLDFLEQQVQGMLREKGSSPSRALVIKQSSGQVSTCEMTLTQKQHPSLGWSYLLGTHRDVTASLPAPEVLKAASRGRLLRAPVEQRHGEEFDEIVLNAWREKISKLVDDGCKVQKPRSAEVETIASVSTACSLSSVIRKADVVEKSGSRSLETPFHLGALASDQSEELPSVLSSTALSSLPFRFFILDPKHEDLPFVLCSAPLGAHLLRSFSTLFLNAKVALPNQNLPAFWAASGRGEFLEQSEILLDAELQNSSGELGACTLILKQVELDDEMFVAGVVPTDRTALDDELDHAVQVMAQDYFYSAPMRRQTAQDEASELKVA